VEIGACVGCVVAAFVGFVNEELNSFVSENF
jgi:hypothetical protein